MSPWSSKATDIAHTSGLAAVTRIERATAWTVRGAVDRAALDAALARGHLGGVGLDVFWDEPWDPADPLFADPRVVTLPHVAGTTTEAFGRVAELVVENVARLQRGASLLHRIG